MESSSIGPQPNVPAPPPPPGWPVMPPPKKPGVPAWAIVVVVVAVVLAALAAVAALVILSTPIGSQPSSLPHITFGAAEAVTNGFEFSVAGASQTRAAANYRVAFSANGTTVGTAHPLAASMTFGAYTITWTDLGGEGDLTGGDAFRVTRAGGLPASTDFIVNILWTTGSAVGSRDYST